jgi:hypothetical protein
MSQTDITCSIIPLPLDQELGPQRAVFAADTDTGAAFVQSYKAWLRENNFP